MIYKVKYIFDLHPVYAMCLVPCSSHFSHVQLFATPWTVACHAPLSMEFSMQKYWSGLQCPSPGDLPDVGIKRGLPPLQTESLPTDPPGKTNSSWYIFQTVVRVYFAEYLHTRSTVCVLPLLCFLPKIMGVLNCKQWFLVNKAVLSWLALCLENQGAHHLLWSYIHTLWLCSLCLWLPPPPAQHCTWLSRSDRVWT